MGLAAIWKTLSTPLFASNKPSPRGIDGSQNRTGLLIPDTPWPVAPEPPSPSVEPTSPESDLAARRLGSESIHYAPMPVGSVSPPAVATASDVARLTQEMETLRGALIQNGSLANVTGRYLANGMTGSSVFALNDPYRFQSAQDPRFRPFSTVSTDTLRTLATTYDELAACIAHLKSEVIKIPFHIVARDADDDSEATKRDIKNAQAWFDSSGGLGGEGEERDVFLGKILDDLIVVGAAALHYDYDTVGAWQDGNPDRVRAIDAGTIRPLVTPFGFKPGNGESAFEQWIMGTPVAQFTRRELSYVGLPIYAQSGSPYFMSPVEMLVIVVFTALKADEWNRTWLTDGNVPDTWMSMPDDMAPEQARAWLELFDEMLAGNSAARHKVRVTPGEPKGGSSRKDSDFDNFSKFLAERTRRVMGVNGASVGSNTGQYEANQEAAMSSTREGMVELLLRWALQRFDGILKLKGWGHLQVIERRAGAEDATARTARQKSEIESGIKSINQVRKENGDEPIEGGDELLIGSTVQLFSRLVAPPEPEPAPEASPTTDTAPIADDATPNNNATPKTAPSAVPSKPPVAAPVARADDASNEPKHKFSCVMAVLGEGAADIVRNFADSVIDKDDLAEDGLETEPHITLRYGLHTNDANEVAEALGRWGGIAAKVMGVSVFEGAETGRDFDVVKLSVEGHDGDLDDIHERLGELEHTDTHATYQPHITLAYVKAGTGRKYLEMPFTHWQGGAGEGDWLRFDTVRFCDRNGDATSIDLENGHARAVERALAQWERKCLNRLTRGQSATCGFESEVLDGDVSADVLVRLEGASDKAKVRDVFASVWPPRSLHL